MIATGGLLRITRRQDSLRTKNRAENKRRRKARKKRKNDIVVVKGKLNLCSVSGMAAAFGVLVLMVGIAMAVLGYWPRENLAHTVSLQRVKPVRQPGNSTRNSQQGSNITSNNKLQAQLNGSDATINSTKPIPPASRHVGFFEDFFSNYQYSDNLKVFGPLVMGIGIFLFICANAVLHENRDKKTKIINLRDIYSTVIDIHSLRSKDCAPFNGLLSSSQSRTSDKPGAYGNPMPSRGSWPSSISCKGLDFPGLRRPSCARKCSWSRERQSLTDTIYSIYRDQARFEEPNSTPKDWETRSIVASSVNAFTLPVIKLNNREMEARERDSSGDRVPCSPKEELQSSSQSSTELISTSVQTKAEVSRPALSASQDSKLSSEVQVGSRAHQQQQLLQPSPGVRILGSHLSLNALSDLAGGRQEERSRRFSCPRLDRSGSKGYIKLAELGGDSFEAPDGAAETGPGTGPEEALWRKCVMIAQALPCISLTQLHTDVVPSNFGTTDADMEPKANL
ncbi:transmembrane protein 200C-like [Astyanax mexicanus]|uniref:Transmembrane protein 200C-like n=1 Tax=Astyanax mexicanus TaxID=7994 RepID=A0A8T2MCP2_ASTMX|nr:transmembrane protein 200C-like [Astyanax mexicanus]